jgi:hypothetical protein
LRPNDDDHEENVDDIDFPKFASVVNVPVLEALRVHSRRLAIVRSGTV